MSTRRRQLGNAIDTIGVLAVVAGLVLGLLPGITNAANAADEPFLTCGTHPTFQLERAVFEVTNGTESFTLDTADDYLECQPDGGKTSIKFADTLPADHPFKRFEGQRLYMRDGLSDAPAIHLSCSETYTGEWLYIGDPALSFPDEVEAQASRYDITLARLNVLKKETEYKVNGDCVAPPSTATAAKVDAEGNGLAGAQFSLFLKDTTTLATTELANPCTTDTTGSCNFGEIPADDYTMTETAPPPGYRLASPGLYEFKVEEGKPQDVVFSFTNPRTPYTITVTPDGRNAVGNSHTFTVTLDDDQGGVVGAVLDLDWTGTGSVQSIVPAGPVGSTCTTDANGDCTVVVNSSAAGSGTLTATFVTPYQNTIGAAPGNSTGSATGGPVPPVCENGYAFAFLYDDGHTDVGCSSDNEISRVEDPTLHAVTIHVSCSDEFPGGVPEKSDLDGHLVDSYSIVKYKDGEIDKTCGDVVDVDNPQPYSSISDDATKTWAGYVATIEPDATNLLGDEHEFTVTVVEVDGAGTPDGVAAAGVAVVLSWSNTPIGSSVDMLACNTDADGTCVVTVDSDLNPGTGVLQVDSLDGIPSGTDEQLVVNYGDGDVAASKTWREYRAVLDGDSVNPVDSAHTFNVQVQYRDTAEDNWTDAADGLTVAWTPGGIGSDDLVASTCDDGTDGDGRCTIVVASGVTGSRDITVTSVTGDLLPDDDDVVGSDELTWTFRDVAYANAPDNADETATKTWVDFGATIVADGRNVAGEPHTFTVTVFQVGPDGETPLATDAVRTSVVFSIDDASNAVLENSCDAGTGTDGECTVTVTSDVAGNATVTVLGIDGLTLGGITTDIDLETQPSATKTWYRYRAWIEPSDLTLVGVPHTFYVTAEQDSGDGWVPVPLGTVIDVSAAGLDSITDDACAVGMDGTGDDPRTPEVETNVCLIEAFSDAPGTTDMTVLSVTPDAAVDSALDTVPVSADDLDPGQSLEASRTWVVYTTDIEPDGVELTGTPQTYYVTAFVDDGTGAVPVEAGTKIVVSDDNLDITPTSNTCATGTGDDPRTDGVTETNVCTVVVNSATPDTVTTSVDEVQALLVDPTGATSATFADDTLGLTPTGERTATKEWVAARVTVEADEINIAGEDHTFTVDVDIVTVTGASAAPLGTTVGIDLGTGVGSLQGQTCDVGTVDGRCTVTVTSSDAGQRTITADSVAFTFGGKAFEVDLEGAVGVADDQDRTATKTWRGYRATLVDDGLELVNTEQVFTVAIEQTDDGVKWTDVPDGTVPTLDYDGIGEIVDDSCDAPDPTDPTDTGGTVDGECTVTVNSPVVGSGTLTLTGIIVDLPEEGRTDEPVDVADVEATKTWVKYFADIEPDEVALTGTALTYYVTATVDDGTGGVPVEAGTQLVLSDDNPAISPTGDSTCATGTGDDPRTDGVTETNVCTVVVTSATPATVTTSVDEVQALLVDGSGATWATFPAETLDVTPGGVRTATKEWVAARVTVEADAINIAGEDHDFDVDVELVTVDGPAVAPDHTVVGLSSTGVGSLAGTTCGIPAGTIGGTCTATVSSDVAGQRSVTAESITFTYKGEVFEVDLDGTAGVADGQDRTATKTWRGYRATLVDDGLELVRTEQVFTVTIEQTDDGTTWVPVPDGTVPTVQFDGTGSIVGGTCDPADPADTAGTDDGDCTVVVNSDVAGPGTLTVSSITVDVPEENRLGVLVDVADVRDTKQWVAVRGDVSPDALNVIGDPHDFQLSAEYTTDGTTWQSVPDGSAIAFGSDGVAESSVTGDDCDSTVGGSCTVTVLSTVTGDRSVSVTGIDLASITEVVGGTELTRDFPMVTLATDATGVQPGTDVDVTATKTWAGYGLALTPDRAVNLLPTDPDHVFTAVLTSTDTTDAPIAGQPLDIAISGDVGTITAVEAGSVDADGLGATCTTDTDGTCDVTVTSTTPGAAELTASYLAQVGASAADTITTAPSTKIWTTYRVTVTPETAVNLVDNVHRFTVLVENSSEDGTWTAVADAVPSIQVTGTGLTIDASDCNDGTAVDGTCVVDVTSSSVQAVTLTATYEASVDQSTAAFSDSGDKEWIDYSLDVTPDTDENLTGTLHTFTVKVDTTFAGEQGPVTAPVVGAFPALVLTGTGAIVDGGDSCTTIGTDADGECTVTISSPVPGLTNLSATYLGTAADDDEVREYGDDGDKLWVDYELVIDPPVATNVVGDPHTFTATLTVDTGQGFGPAAGETLQFTLGGVGEATGGDVDDTLSCTTDADGQCDIVINSTEVGSTTVDVAYGAVVGATSDTFTADGLKRWVDIELVKTAVVGDGFGDGDLVADPDTGIPFLSFGSLDPASKTAVFEYEITNPSGVTLENVALFDDRLLDIDLTGSGCEVLEPGESCTVRDSEQFNYDDAVAALGLPITNVAVVTATGDGEEVTDVDDAVIRLVPFTEFDYLLELTPDVATNAVDDPHTFTATLTVDTGDGFGPAAGETLQFSVDGVGETVGGDVDDTLSCTTDASGQCDIVINSSAAGSTTVGVDYDNDGDTVTGVFTDSGVKRWVDIELVKTAVVGDGAEDGDLVADPDTGIPFMQFTFVDPGPRTAVFEYAITNPSPVTLVDVALTDNRLGDIDLSLFPDCQVLDPGETCFAYASEEFDFDAAVASEGLPITNIGTVTATGDGEDVSDEDDAQVRIIPEQAYVYDLVLDPPTATNAVNDPHTFTATLTVDLGQGFGPAAGETLQFTLGGVGTAVGGDVADDLTCTTDEVGQCEIVVDSAEVGDTNVGVTYDNDGEFVSGTFADDGVKTWVDIQLVKTAVTSGGFGDGDLEPDPEGFPFLTFSSNDLTPKTAVFEYLLTNPSSVTLENVALADDRLGDIDLTLFPDCQVLDPGESCTARASEQFDYFDAREALGDLITNVAVVTATGDGEEVSDVDDADIVLVPVQGSILLDLVKEVVAGDDVQIVDGKPIVSWSQAEYEAGEPKMVTYRFTVTNISNNTIVDVELTDPMISDLPIIAVEDGVTLEPDESISVEVDYVLTVDQAFTDGPIGSKIDNVAGVSGANVPRDSFSEAVDDASVFTEVVFSEVIDLPATGLQRLDLLPMGVLLSLLGVAILWVERRRRPVA